jgi:sulfide:quinone oxidoreductase
MRILILGAGFGGLELTERLSEEFGAAVDVTLIDRVQRRVVTDDAGFGEWEIVEGRYALPVK